MVPSSRGGAGRSGGHFSDSAVQPIRDLRSMLDGKRSGGDILFSSTRDLLEGFWLDGWRVVW